LRAVRRRLPNASRSSVVGSASGRAAACAFKTKVLVAVPQDSAAFSGAEVAYPQLR
jgi:hypothetical protein